MQRFKSCTYSCMLRGRFLLADTETAQPRSRRSSGVPVKPQRQGSRGAAALRLSERTLTLPAPGAAPEEAEGGGLRGAAPRVGVGKHGFSFFTDNPHRLFQARREHSYLKDVLRFFKIYFLCQQLVNFSTSP